MIWQWELPWYEAGTVSRWILIGNGRDTPRPNSLESKQPLQTQLCFSPFTICDMLKKVLKPNCMISKIVVSKLNLCAISFPLHVAHTTSKTGYNYSNMPQDPNGCHSKLAFKPLTEIFILSFIWNMTLLEDLVDHITTKAGHFKLEKCTRRLGDKTSESADLSIITKHGLAWSAIVISGANNWVCLNWPCCPAGILRCKYSICGADNYLSWAQDIYGETIAF